jgi:hypothetical protein
MDATKITQQNNAAWNRHDADAVLAAYAEGGTYSNPRGGEGLTGEAIRNYVKAVWLAYPAARLGRWAKLRLLRLFLNMLVLARI